MTAQNLPCPVEAFATTDVGLCAGTRVMTADGEIPVEHLTAGDRIITRGVGFVALRGITIRRARIRPVVIKAGSLGHHRPEGDITVAPDTRIHIRDWRAPVLFGRVSADVEARRLADGEFVAQRPARLMQVFDLGFDEDQIIYADGVEVMIPAR